MRSSFCTGSAISLKAREPQALLEAALESTLEITGWNQVLEGLTLTPLEFILEPMEHDELFQSRGVVINLSETGILVHCCS